MNRPLFFVAIAAETKVARETGSKESSLLKLWLKNSLLYYLLKIKITGRDKQASFSKAFGLQKNSFFTNSHKKIALSN
jgi:hypothetical protein